MLNSSLPVLPFGPFAPSSESSPATRPRLIFANQLRGIAALLVVMTHLFGVYFVAPEYVTRATFSQPVNFVEPAWVPYFHPSFSGPFGVALFFLISGFVIPFSLEQKNPLRFLVLRFFRIIPTYCVALGLSMLALYLSARYWGNTFEHGARAMVANGLLVHVPLGIESIDPVNWSLSVEVKFYLLMAFVGPWILRRSFVPCALFLMAALGVAACSPGFPWIYSILALELNYIMFMMIGIGFYQHFQAVIGSRELVARSLFIFAMFAGSWSLGPQKAQFPDITQYYLYAVLTFALAYCLRSRFRPLRVLDFLADISYPLYAVHSLIGWVLLRRLMGQGMAFAPALGLTVAAIIGCAYLLHRLIEIPSNRLGKRLAAS